MKRRNSYEAAIDKRSAVKSAEAAGEVADSLAVRMALIARIGSGEITPQAANAELKKIKRGAKKAGKVTRAQAFNDG